ncbi:DNA transfer protein [Helicobacter cetorum]|uniref:VirB4 family type IV secretion/conjugal transfer ATPase n=1 Tax=Helicobacter cetorum TaxID=138563 RepID=UPI000CF1A5CF|nr:DNA transfer protein [Helicobacter cetorum]
MNFVEFLKNKASSMFFGALPKHYSMAEENNILGLYNDDFILTKKGNLVGMIALEGISYADLNDEQITKLFNERIVAFNLISSDVEMKIIAKRRKAHFNQQYEHIKNHYAKTIINLWESNEEVYTNSYYLIFETKDTYLKGFLERKKQEWTTSIKEQENKQEESIKEVKTSTRSNENTNNTNSEIKDSPTETIAEDKEEVKEETTNNSADNKTNEKQEINKESNTTEFATIKSTKKLTFINKETLLQSIINSFLQVLSPLKPKQMPSIEVLRFYAEYINGIYLPFKVHNGLLRDSYIASNVHFHKDYFIQEYNGHTTCNRFISIKAYDTDEITSVPLSTILSFKSDFDIIISIDALNKDKATSKIEEKRKRANEIIKPAIENLNNLVKTDRVSIEYVSLMVLLKTSNKQELDKKSLEIVNTFKNHGLIAIYETINLKPIFFSFFPNRNNLNARKRLQSSDNVATMLMFDKEHNGRDRNSWGRMPLTMFKTQSQSLFLFNFHAQEVLKDTDMVLGHTMILGGTGAGKTTLMSFLILNCFKYNINILALDRLNGMRIMSEFLNAEYNDSENFALNPFSLEKSSENITFLSSWASYLIGLDENKQGDIENIKAIEKCVNDLYHNLYDTGTKFGLKDLKDSVVKTSNETISMQLDRAMDNPLFNQLESSLKFSQQLTAINMDSIVQNPKNASLIALILFHTMIYEAKKHAKGFFIFIDEARSYIENEVMMDKINLTLTQARKVNGVLALAFQDINQLDGMSNARSMVDNMAHIILFPTSNLDKLESYGINLTPSEKAFLTSPSNYKVLVKNKLDGTSNILDVNLSKLGKYLKILSSSAPSVAKLLELKQQYPNNYKERFLAYE